MGSGFPIGIQVIALGNTNSRESSLPGPSGSRLGREHRLPHRGQDPEDGRTVFHGIHGERLKFASSNFRGSIRDGVFTGEAHTFHGRADSVEFRLEKVLRKSPTLGAKPPAGALVLFDGSGVGKWEDGRLVENGLLDVGTTSKRKFGSVRIHLEFRCPFMPTARGMKRGNSGVYVKREWEVQIVDSFGWHHENRKFERLSKFGRAGGIHEMVGPRINMSLPPLSWQTYDIEFTRGQVRLNGKEDLPGDDDGPAQRGPDPRPGRAAAAAARIGRAQIQGRRTRTHLPAGPRQPGALPQHLGRGVGLTSRRLVQRTGKPGSGSQTVSP